MIAIRSTEKKATSNNDGNCDVLRKLVGFRFDIKNMFFETDIVDSLFIEKKIVKNIDNEGKPVEKAITIIERIIIETRIQKTYKYSVLPRI